MKTKTETLSVLFLALGLALGPACGGSSAGSRDSGTDGPGSGGSAPPAGPGSGGVGGASGGTNPGGSGGNLGGGGAMAGAGGSGMPGGAGGAVAGAGGATGGMGGAGGAAGAMGGVGGMAGMPGSGGMGAMAGAGGSAGSGMAGMGGMAGTPGDAGPGPDAPVILPPAAFLDACFSDFTPPSRPHQIATKVSADGKVQMRIALEEQPLIALGTPWGAVRFALATEQDRICLKTPAELQGAYMLSHHNCRDVFEVTVAGRTYTIEHPDTAPMRQVATLTVRDGSQAVLGPVMLQTTTCATREPAGQCRSGGPCGPGGI